jgi:hypothetical protein
MENHMYQPEHLVRWTKPDSYFGASWPEYYSSGVGQSRDSDALEASNFRSMLKALGGESETVLVVRESHWAVGWVEWIAIHETDDKALAAADEIKTALEDYPVVDEDDFSELKQEHAEQTWQNCFNDAARLAYIREHRSQFEFRDYADLIGCVRGRYFAGYASELLN